MIFQESSTRFNRVAVYCFNVSPDFAASFKFQKSKGEGEFGVKYMLAAFDKEDGSGEFFIEFDEKVWEHKLVECFQAQGAGQVTTITFANNDGGESAANALACIMTSQKKYGDGYTRGVCNPILYTKAHTKMEAAIRQEEQLGAKEFDEKTSAAIKFSLETHAVKLEAIEDGVQAHAVKLEAIESGVQAQTVDLVDIKQGVCSVIPDYQIEIKALKDALVKSNSARDTTEGKLGHKTRIVNQQDAYIIKLEEDQTLHVQEKQAWKLEKNKLLAKYSALQEELAQSKSLQKILEKAGHIAEILSSTLAEEREAKRRRV